MGERILSPLGGISQEYGEVWCSFLVQDDTGEIYEKVVYYDNIDDARADLKDLQHGPLELHDHDF